MHLASSDCFGLNVAITSRLIPFNNNDNNKSDSNNTLYKARELSKEMMIIV